VKTQEHDYERNPKMRRGSRESNPQGRGKKIYRVVRDKFDEGPKVQTGRGVLGELHQTYAANKRVSLKK